LLYRLHAVGDLLLEHLVVAARVQDDVFVVDVGGVGAHLVEEATIVGDDHEHAAVLHQEVGQPLDRLEVEVVGGLVEQQDVGRSEQGLGQQHPQTHAAGEHRELFLLHVGGNAQADEQALGLVLGVVPVFLGDGHLELGELHADLVVHLAGGEQLFLLLHRGPQARVAHDHDVGNLVVLVLVVILVQHRHAGLGRDRDRAGVGLEVSRQDLHERRLAGTVGPGQAVAVAGLERGGHVVEQNAAAIRLPDLRNGEHEAGFKRDGRVFPGPRSHLPQPVTALAPREVLRTIWGTVSG